MPNIRLSNDVLGKRGSRKAKEREDVYNNMIAIKDDVVPPSYLDDEAKQLWSSLLPLLKLQGTISEADLDQFATYCESQSHANKCARVIREEGMQVENHRGQMIAHPLLMALRSSRSLANKLAQQFGMTPSSRTNLRATPVKIIDPLLDGDGS